MFPNSLIALGTIKAYQETDYHVHGAAPFTLSIGAPCRQIAELHKIHCVESSGFITACNPFSQGFDDVANAERQLALAKELQVCSLKFVEGIGQHPSNEWPAEASFLVLGVSLEAAKAMGVKYGQNAIIWIGADAIPQLILLR